jgi:hypothetical protein
MSTKLLFSVVLLAILQQLCLAAAPPFPKFTFHVRKERNPDGISPSRSTSTRHLQAKDVSTTSRGGAVAAVKTMTARQFEAFK